MDLAFNINKEPENATEVSLPNMNDPLCDVQYRKEIEDFQAKSSTDVKQHVTCKVKSEVHDFEIDNSYDDATIKLEIFHEEVDIKTEVLNDDEDASAKETAKNKLFECSLGNSRSSCICNVHEFITSPTNELFFECDTCHSTCSQERDLHEHNQIRSEEKRSKCIACGHGRAKKHALKRQMSSRTGTGRLKCPMCYARILMCNVELHMKTHLDMNVNTKVKKYECSICTYATSRKYWLIAHTQTHRKKT